MTKSKYGLSNFLFSSVNLGPSLLLPLLLSACASPLGRGEEFPVLRIVHRQTTSLVYSPRGVEPPSQKEMKMV